MPRPEPVTVTTQVLRAWPLPVCGDDKESRGRTLVIGGSDQTPGAVLLAAESALRSGAGKLQVATVSSVAPHVAVALPESLVRPLPQSRCGDISPSAADVLAEMATGCGSVLIGPGIRDVDTCVELLSSLVPRLDVPTVIDAIALAYVGRCPDGLRHLEGQVVLTPNRSELALTLGVDQGEVDDDPGGAAARLADRTGAVVAGGGSTSWVADTGGRLWRDDAGGLGLGVSGSGDVMAGIVAGLAARGATPAQAAVWAAHLHGRAGDRLAAGVGRLGFLARELPAEVPRVLAEIEV